MKKTLNINLAGYPFTIDEDAYNILKDYLDTIKYAFDTNDDTGEIAADIESRVAEILLENEAGNRLIVTREEISKVIERIGRPSEFMDIKEEVIEENRSAVHDSTPPPPPPYEAPRSNNIYGRKKLFRDPQNALLGGVCSGLAAYLNMDVTVIRILTVLLFFLSATTVGIAYIILWIVVPEARTPYQRMQMHGQDPTMENIARTVTGNYGEDYSNDPYYERSQKPEGFLSSALSVFVKVLIIIGLIIALPLLFAFAVAFLGCAIAVFVIGLGLISGGMFDSVQEGLMVLYILLAVIGGAITVGIPLWLLVRMAFKRRNSNPNPSTRRALLIVWLCAIAMCAVFTVKAVREGRKIDKHEIVNSVGKFKIIDEEEDEDDWSEIKEINIGSDGIMVKDSNGKIIRLGEDGIKINTSDSTNSTKENEEIIDVNSTTVSVDSIQ